MQGLSAGHIRYVTIDASPGKSCAVAALDLAPARHSSGVLLSKSTTPLPQSECAGASLAHSATPLRERAPAARPKAAPCHTSWAQGAGRVGLPRQTINTKPTLMQ